MKSFKKHERGQALVIFVFALIGLVGITGLAIDGGMIFSDRRNAQNAADTAAMAGAIVKIEGQKANNWTDADCITSGSACWSAVVNAALDRASSNGYTGNLVDSTVEVHIPPISGPYSDCANYSFRCEDYIQVIISSNVNTFFARVLGVFQMHNQVEAVALANYEAEHGLYGGNALVELKPGDPCTSAGDFILSGSGIVRLIGGGMWINSDCSGVGETALKEGANCVTFDPPEIPISLVGEYDAASCEVPRNITQVTYQYPFPPDDFLPEPAQCQQTSPPYTVTGPDASGYYTYSGGYYAENTFPPTRNAILSPGIYCVENAVKLVGNNSTITGDNVLIWIKDGGGFSLEQGYINLTGRSDPNDPYYGFLFYVDSDYLPSWGIESCDISGGAFGTFTGAIYAPDCNVTINGSSLSASGFTSQIIAYTLKLDGSATLNFTYEEDLMPQVPEKRDTGLYR